MTNVLAYLDAEIMPVCGTDVDGDDDDDDVDDDVGENSENSVLMTLKLLTDR